MMGDGTMSIPNGSNMMALVEDIAEKPDELKARLKNNVKGTIEWAKVLRDAGATACLMCADYCFNAGPFLSPTMFREFVTPYLTASVADLRELGFYTIKHTDGDIIPILDQLVEARPHALHSIDPQAGVSLKKVKEMVGDKVALCGNVHCGMLHNGTKEQIIEDSKRALRDGMPGGGYFFCSSNTPFRGMPLENYLAMLDVRKSLGRYDGRQL
jgi:uroporphyrinogen decarboxylase